MTSLSIVACTDWLTALRVVGSVMGGERAEASAAFGRSVACLWAPVLVFMPGGKAGQTRRKRRARRLANAESV